MLHNQMLIVSRTIAQTRELVDGWRAAGLRVGVVPTMGALHAGHLALVARARAENDRVLATIFVNPLQFGPAEDFAAYPRDDERDFGILREVCCDAVFAPHVDEMFPDPGRSLAATPTRVSVAGFADVLCGQSRPGHFDGVATIVLKLLMITRPDVAYFGEKDFQQLRIVEQLVRDLSVPVRIAAVPIVRDEDGLALSSRNVYLDPAQRLIAPHLFRILGTVRGELLVSQGNAQGVIAAGRDALVAAGFDRVDYFTLASRETLETLSQWRPGTRLFAAVWLGQTRLIDNIAL
jgi:pantoate--beta-alanine ligase